MPGHENGNGYERNVTPESFANEAAEPEKRKEANSPEMAQLIELLEEGKLNNGQARAAETAIKNGDINTIRGILNRYKQGGE